MGTTRRSRSGRILLGGVLLAATAGGIAVLMSQQSDAGSTPGFDGSTGLRASKAQTGPLTPRLVTTLPKAGTSPRFVEDAVDQDDGSRLITLAGADSGTPKVLSWKLADRTSTTLFAPAQARDLELSPDGRLAVTNRRRGTALWDVAGGTSTPVAVLSKDVDLHIEGPYAFSPDGATVAAVWSQQRSSDLLLGVRSWDAASHEARPALRLSGRSNAGPEGRNVMVDSLAFSPDGTTLAVGGSNLFRPTEDAADGSGASAAGSAQVEFLDLPHRRVLGGLTGASTAGGDSWEKANTSVRSVAYSPDGRFLAISLEVAGASPVYGGVQLWDARTRQLVATVDETGGGTVVFSPDGRLLSYGAADGVTLRLWEVAGKRNAGTIDLGGQPDGRAAYTGRQSFDRDGSRLAVPVGDDVQVWSLR